MNTIPTEIINKMNQYNVDRRIKKEYQQDRILANIELKNLIDELSHGIGE